MDAASASALVKALQKFTGAVVLVSHDQYLLDNCCNSLWQVDKVSNFKQSKKPKKLNPNQQQQETVVELPPSRSRIVKFRGTFADYCDSLQR